MLDAQSQLGFVLQQTAHIETETYKTQYPSIQYHKLVPVDTSGSDWASSIVHFSSDQTGVAEPLSNRATDVPLVDVNRTKHDVSVDMFGIGYDFSLQEIGQAQMIPGLNLKADKAIAARRASEEFIDKIVLNGNADYGWDGLLNNTNVSKSDAAANAAGDSKKWDDKTAQEILKDINDALQGVYTDSSTVEMADTLLFPPTQWSNLLSKTIAGTSTNVVDYIKQGNVYTQLTGKDLMIRSMRGLENAASGNKGRMIAYNRDPSVLKLHMPMPHKFLRPYQYPMKWVVAGMFRLGGLEIRRPKAIRYVDAIS